MAFLNKEFYIFFLCVSHKQKMSSTVNLFHTGGFSLFCQFLFLCVISSIIGKPNQIYGIICHCFVRGLISLFRWIYQSLTKPFFAPISNGNRTEWSPIRSVIIRVINKIRRPRSGSPILQTELDDTKFCYQLIITLTKFVT